MGLRHTKRREESSRAAQGVWQAAVVALYESQRSVGCIYRRTHTCARGWESTVCFPETGASSHCFIRFPKSRHPETGETVFSLASTCDMKRDLWKTDLSTSLSFGRLQGFPLVLRVSFPRQA